MKDAPSDPQPRRATTYITALNSQRIGLGALGFWAVAIAILILHVAGLPGGISDALYFATAETWLLGLGCVGTPILALRALGRHLTATSSLLISALLAGGALTYTMFLPSMHPGPLTATFVLVPLLAGAIHCANASDAIVREREAERRGEIRAADGFEIRHATDAAEIERLCVERDGLLKQVADLTAAVTEAENRAAASFRAGAEAGAIAHATEARKRAEERAELDRLPLADVRPLRGRTEQSLPPGGAQPLFIVPSREADARTHPWPTNGHRTEG